MPGLLLLVRNVEAAALESFASDPEVDLDPSVDTADVGVFHLPAQQIQSRVAEQVLARHSTVVAGQLRPFAGVEIPLDSSDLLVAVFVVVQYAEVKTVLLLVEGNDHPHRRAHAT